MPSNAKCNCQLDNTIGQKGSPHITLVDPFRGHGHRTLEWLGTVSSEFWPFSTRFGFGPVQAESGQSGLTETRCRQQMRDPGQRKDPHAFLGGPKTFQGGYRTQMRFFYFLQKFNASYLLPACLLLPGTQAHPTNPNTWMNLLKQYVYPHSDCTPHLFQVRPCIAELP